MMTDQSFDFQGFNQTAFDISVMKFDIVRTGHGRNVCERGLGI